MAIWRAKWVWITIGIFLLGVLTNPVSYWTGFYSAKFAAGVISGPFCQEYSTAVGIVVGAGGLYAILLICLLLGARRLGFSISDILLFRGARAHDGMLVATVGGLVLGYAAFSVGQRPDDAAIIAGAKVFSFAIVVVLWEEVLFRGVLLRSILQAHGQWASALLSATIFMLPHVVFLPVSIIGAMLIWTLGMLLAFLYMRFGNLVACCAAHAIYNTLTLI